MKGNFSRDSYQSKDHYSGVFQVQGGMVTDADLGEQAKIARSRTDQLGHDAAGSGVPNTNGAVQITGSTPALAEGVVYAEGVRGETEASGNLTDGLSLYAQQVDFPLPPSLPQTGNWLLYADVWQRVVTGLEDSLLSDPGLHGAETALRQRTTTQIKFMPLAQAQFLGNINGAFPKHGNGVLTITPVDPDIIADNCDPCADVVAAEQTVSNSLFRIEVVHVIGDAQTPDQILIAWSDENAMAVAPASVNSEDFSRAGAVYEYFSTDTEKHLGVHQANNSVARSSFAESLAAGPATANAPDGGNWPFVRRWSGAVLIDFAAETATRVGGGSAGVSISANVVSITVDAFTAEIDFNSKAVVAGDYWLIETRRHGENPIRVVSATPLGIIHHYCPLFRISDGAIVNLTDEENRRLSFPALSNVPASHVGFDNNCDKLYADAENVQEALDNLCDIDASDISFDPDGCSRLFDSTDNVQDALINLCKVDFGNERLLRLLHDWGVVCGVIPSLSKPNDSVVTYSKGAILDRVGKLADVETTTVDLNTLVNTKFFHFENFNDFAIQLRKKEVCLALAIDPSGNVETHLASKNRAFSPEDPTFLSVLQKCLKKNKSFDFSDDFSNRPELEKVALDKVVYGASNKKLAASQRLNSREQKFARNYNDGLVTRYKAFIKDDNEAATLDLKIKEIDEDIKPDEATGAVRETRFMLRESLVYRTLYELENDRLRKCLCKALLPQCPNPGKAPHLIPIACLNGVIGNNQIILHEVCVLSCRKQAISWRTVSYFASEIIQNFSERIAEYCCQSKAEDIPSNRPRLKAYDLDIRTELTVDKVIQQVDKGVQILTGRKPPNDFRVKPVIDDLGVDQAKVALKGYGIDVARTFELSDAEAVKKIREASIGVDGKDLVLDNGEVAPGDKVALITQDGIAIDYVKLETGGGKYLYQTEKATNVTIPSAKDFSEAAEKAAALEARIEGTKTSTSNTKSDLDKIKMERDAINDEVDTLNNSLQEIQSKRTAVMTEIDTAKKELNKLKTNQEKLLTTMAKERDEIVSTIRRETPITAVSGGEEQLTAVLIKKRVTNLGELVKLSDTDLRKFALEARVNLNTARRIKREAATHINAPI